MARKRTAAKPKPTPLPGKVRKYLLDTGTADSGLQTVWDELNEAGRKALVARAEKHEVGKRKPKGVTDASNKDADQPASDEPT